MLRFLIIVIFSSLLPLGASAATWNISGSDIRHLKNALDDADRGRWDLFSREMDGVRDTTVKNTLLWVYYTNGKSRNFIELSQFLQHHPGWPQSVMLQRLTEQAIDGSLSPELLDRWFSHHPPITAKGMQYDAEAKITLGQKDEGSVKTIRSLLRKAWINGNFLTQDERIFLNRHNDQLTQEDHHKRINRLLWNARIEQANRIMYKADNAHKKLFETRIRLQRNMQGIDNILRQVPAYLRHDEGLLYDRIKWRERRGMDTGVQELLNQVPLKTKYPQHWWNIKNRQIRSLINAHQYTKAYKLASLHGLKQGEDFAEAEWLSGWLALRFLHKPDIAYKHFYRLYHNVQYPVSLARGAYWAGRATEANGNQEMAKSWFQVAAKYNKTFYGLLAIERLSPDHPSYFSADTLIKISQQDHQSLQQNTMAKVAYALLKARKSGPMAKSFVTHAVMKARTPGEKELIGNLALSFRRYELAVAAAKEAAKEGIFLANSGYPTVAEVKGRTEQRAFHLAIIRQESEFNRDARSMAGAMGYMQLMPATAKEQAQKLGIRYDARRLAEPAYNIRLGTNYLQRLFNLYDQNYVLATAAYNAGPGNVLKWQRQYGKYKYSKTLEDAIDWIELIPFSETRNYVHRVLENMVVYSHSMSPEQRSLSSLLLQH